MNAREVAREGIVFCARCAGVDDYYVALPREAHMLAAAADVGEGRP
jgi:hypothetical protein